jgi:hypothetical protein
MDGRQYIEHFEALNPEGQDFENLDLGIAYSTDLTQKISLLHLGEVFFLGDTPEPLAVSHARETMKEITVTRLTHKASSHLHHKRLIELGYTYMPDSVDSSRILEALEAGDPSVGNTVNQDARGLQDVLTNYSDITLATAILGVHRANIKNPDTHNPAKQILPVKNAIAMQRPRLVDISQPYRGTVTVTRDTYDRKDVGFSVEANGKHRQVPDWLVNTEDWDTPLHRFMASVIELETLIVANEWSIDRGHTFVPVLAPRHMEQGFFVGDKNPHADILLCNVSTSTNEIVPLQIKNHVRQKYIDRYIDEMEFITPEDLGIRHTETATVKNVRGRAATGTRSITNIGHIAAAFTARYNKARKPSKQDIAAFNQLLEPGFATLDAIIERQRQSGYAEARTN